MVSQYLELMRLQQWLKNSFVLVGIFFGHFWSDWYLISQAICVAFAFCCMSSAVYIVNDFFDRQFDRLHPLKNKRPLAANTVSLHGALLLTVVLSCLSLCLGFAVSWQAGLILLIYLLINMAYSIVLKHIPFVEVLIITLGFMLRILGGTTGLGVAPSVWLLACSLLLTLFLSFSKRRSEMSLLQQGVLPRKVLQHYSEERLNVMISITAIGAFLNYLFYVFYHDHLYSGVSHLAYTIPLVAYGMLRYLYLLYNGKLLLVGGDISRVLYSDWPLFVTVVIWLFMMGVLL